MIRIKVHAVLSELLGLGGTTTLELPGAPSRSLGELFAELAELYPILAELSDPGSANSQKGVVVAIDGMVVAGEDRFESMVSDGQEVQLFPVYRGG